MPKAASKIIQLQYQIHRVAVDISHLMQNSYAVEALLLNVEDFPPLRRTALDIQNSGSIFYGCMFAAELVAAIEITCEQQVLEIHSLVVSPDYFRQGLAGRLLDFVFKKYAWQSATVETGRDNIPAIQLYQNHGFKITRNWQTESKIMKVELQKKAD